LERAGLCLLVGWDVLGDCALGEDLR